MHTDRAIVLTPPGSGAIAVIRLTGPGVGTFLHAHFTGNPAEGRCAYGDLHDGERVIDDAVVVLSQGGFVADLNVHGGPWVVRSVLDIAERSGFSVSSSEGSNAIAAVDGDGLLDSEMLAALPLAQTELALRVLLAQPEAWRGLLSSSETAMTQIEAAVADESLHWLLHPPTVAIVGAPNVGKSTLANQLFGQERSITADLPGTTRDWVGETANIDGLAVTLLDTPGVRVTNDAIERAAIAHARDPIRRADLILVVLDASQPLEEQQAIAVEHPDAIWVVNKSDQSIGWDAERPDVIRTVATTGQGVDAVRSMVRFRFLSREIELRRPRWWTDRQRTLLTEAISDCSKLTALI